MKIINSPVKLEQLWQECETGFVDMIKIVVDVEREILAADAEMHADLEELLLSDSSSQEYLWGANIYPGKPADDRIEFTALINIRPGQDNRSMEVEDKSLRQKMKTIIGRLLVD